MQLIVSEMESVEDSCHSDDADESQSPAVPFTAAAAKEISFIICLTWDAITMHTDEENKAQSRHLSSNKSLGTWYNVQQEPQPASSTQ